MSNDASSKVTVSSRLCPVCGSSEHSFLMEKYDDRYGYPGVFHFFLCEKCNTGFLGETIDAKEIADLYEKYYIFPEHPINSKRSWKQVLSEYPLVKWIMGEIPILSRVQEGSSVLEIGPGTMDDAKVAEIRRKRLRWTGLEVNPKYAERIRDTGFPVYAGSIEDVSSISGNFDVIALSMSIEHQMDLDIFFKNCRSILNPEGSIIFTTANFNSRYRKKFMERWLHWHPPYHQVLLSRGSIEAICRKHGFSLMRFETITPVSWFLLQRKFSLPNIGEKNNRFRMSFSIMEYMLAIIFLRISDCLSRMSGDSLYCEIKIR